MNDIDKVKQKLIKIRQRKKQKQNYNYTNVSILPTVYNDENNDTLITDLQPLTNLNHTTPELSGFYNPYNNGIYDNNVVSVVDKPLNKPSDKLLATNNGTITSYLSSTYRYFFPVKEGATDSSPPPFDLTNLSFWQIPCDFLNTKFYDDLIDKILRVCAGEEDEYKDNTKLISDRELIQTTIKQMLMIVLAYIMTVNVYYFVFMYKWDCSHFAYLPGHGMYFGFGKKEKDINMMVDFFLRDIRKPVFYCSFIYTMLYPSIFNLLGVGQYKRLCFVFIFLFMLCFVFITMKDIELAAFSFVSSGKINPLVMVIVLCSVFTGIFFTSQANEDEILQKALEARDNKENPCITETVSKAVLDFNFEQIELKNQRKPYYYSQKEKNVADIASSVGVVQKGGLDGSDIPQGIDPKIMRLGQYGFAKGPLTINAIIRVIISMALLPVAQIFVTFFFLYTTSGLGLIINEGFNPLYKVMAHMNDNDGEDNKEDIPPSPFYKIINKTLFFKWWVNEYFISSMLTIFLVVKSITIPLLLSKLNIKIVAAVVLGFSAVCFIFRFCYLYFDYIKIMKGDDISNTVNPIYQEPSSPPPSIDANNNNNQLSPPPTDADNNQLQPDMLKQYPEPNAEKITIDLENPMHDKTTTKPTTTTTRRKL